MEASVGEELVARARAVFEWLEGGAFLVQHADAEPPPPQFTATFSGDGDTLTGCRERSRDGTHWQHDFDVTYKRVT
jgi:hypothetical protein